MFHVNNIYHLSEIKHFSPKKYFTLNSNKILNPYFEGEIDNSNRQNYGSAFIRNGSCYSFTMEKLLSDKPWSGKSTACVVPQSRNIDIDNKFDFEIAEFLYSRINP